MDNSFKNLAVKKKRDEVVMKNVKSRQFSFKVEGITCK